MKNAATFWTGTNPKRPECHITVYCTNGRITATLYDTDGAWLLETQPSGEITAVQIDPSGDEEEFEQDQPGGLAKSAASSSDSALSFIDVIVFYSSEYRASFSSADALDDEINFRIEESNFIFENSRIKIAFRLVHHEELALTDNIQSAVDVRADADVTRLRDQYGADLVTFWTIGGKGGTAHTYTGEERSAFSTMTKSNIQSKFKFTHETGHNLGAKHDRVVYDRIGTYQDNYNYGLCRHDYRSVMAYSNCTGGSCPRVPYFTNPYVTVNNERFGIPLGEADPAHNARRLNDTRAVVEGFRDIAYEGHWVLSVVDGDGDGPYLSGETVEITASAAPDSMVFDQWAGDIAAIDNPNSPSTTVNMPAHNCALYALYSYGNYVSTVDKNVKAANSLSIAGISSRRVSIHVAEPGSYRVSLYSIDGRAVGAVSEQFAAGKHMIDFDDAGIGSSIYFAAIQGKGKKAVQKLVPLR
ncbi:MAG: hypothetical protein GF401_03265 [Chitinivibrionales bacterium]|nr:hypothetical protein [Chitinivibrionales bacterium]